MGSADRALRCSRCTRAHRQSRTFTVKMLNAKREILWWYRLCERCGLWMMLKDSPLQHWNAVDGQGATPPTLV